MSLNRSTISSKLDEPHGMAAGQQPSDALFVGQKIASLLAGKEQGQNRASEPSLSGTTPPGDHALGSAGDDSVLPLGQAPDVPEDLENSPRLIDLSTHDFVGKAVLSDQGIEARKQLRNRQVPFNGKILFIGCGALAQCVLPMLPRLVNMPMSNITVLDAFDQRDKIKSSLERGVKFVLEKVTKDTVVSVLDRYLSPGDLLVDLAYEISTITFLDWCRQHDVLYINAALEVDDPYQDASNTDVRKFTLYHRHQELERRMAEWGSNNGPTAVLEHGANPGLVSHFVKLAMIHIGQKIIKEKPLENPARTREIEHLIATKNFPRLGMVLGVKVIHVSERDTQLTDQPKRLNEFVNTWSPLGFFQEGVAPAELGWGSHERNLPPNGVAFEGPGYSICMKTKGMNTYVRSWVPTPDDSGDIIGMVVRHGEAYTIPQHLSVYDENGKCIYRPTCHYAYLPSNEAMNSLQELRMRGYNPQPKTRVLKDEITEGRDVLGCLLMGHDFGAWWIGSLLDINEARDLVPHQSATIVQVGSGFATALQWILANPHKGVCNPDDLPYNEIIREAMPFLGPFVSIPVDWNPLQAAEREKGFEYRTGVLPDPKADPWQFTSFLIQ